MKRKKLLALTKLLRNVGFGPHIFGSDGCCLYCGITPMDDPGPCVVKQRKAAAQATAEQPLQVGDAVEIVGPSNSGMDYRGAHGEIRASSDSENSLWSVALDVDNYTGWFPASSLRRIEQPVAPAEYAYIAGECCETNVRGKWETARYVRLGIAGHCIMALDGTALGAPAHKIRPVAAVPGCAVLDTQDGLLKIYDGRMVRWPCPAPGSNYTDKYDPAIHRVIALPREPAAEPAQARALAALTEVQ